MALIFPGGEAEAFKAYAEVRGTTANTLFRDYVRQCLAEDTGTIQSDTITATIHKAIKLINTIEAENNAPELNT